MYEYCSNEMMRPAFQFDEEMLTNEFDPNVPPSSAQEYLHRVITEASMCDTVVTAEIDPTKIRPQKSVEVLPGLQEAAHSMIPSEKWQRCQVSDFSGVRKIMQRVKAGNRSKIELRIPGRRDEQGWRKVCIGDNPESGGNFETSPPLLSIFINPSMTQNMLLQVLEYNVAWLAEGFSDRKARWLYALMACLELPLYPETCSLLRELARECARIRATLDSPDHEFVAPLNLLICIVAKYYRQLDLAD